MAACDNLYGNREEWIELHDYLYDNNPKHLEYMKRFPLKGEEDVRICYIASIQGWLIKNCPLKWVKDRLSGNFEVQTMICGKPHHILDEGL